jgi:L-alanine-DL-glutamate epimerase-like enolase superfamily enzyme
MTSTPAPIRPARADAAIDCVEATAYTIPTDAPESDGTFAWDSTTIVVVEVHGGGERGLGYTYGPAAVARIVTDLLADAARGADALRPRAAHAAAERALRNAGRRGPGAMALSALDVALWDLTARLLGVALFELLGGLRDRVAAYGSGGFTAYGDDRLADQLSGWAAQGFRRVKMKVGRDPASDEHRVDIARTAIGSAVALMVDANGAYTPREAVGWAERFAARGVVWLEEPVSSDDLDGLRFVRQHAPYGLAVTAGEYVWSDAEAHAMLDAGAVDVLQLDVTRCGGITAALRIDALARARCLPTSLHCAPSLSAHAGAAMETFTDLEWFHDHVRIEQRLFDGAAEVDRSGQIVLDAGRPGLGLELRRDEAERFEA